MNEKKLAIMQPYFFPYIGYFQLINAVDEFVIYDNIEFTKKGWINRNRILVNGVDAYFSLPLKKDSDYLHVKDRFLADTWDIERKKLLNRITESYRKAQFFKETYEVFEKCIMHEDRNLFNFLLNSVQTIIDYLGIDTKLIISSSIPIDHQLKGEEKVMAICKQQQAGVYINPIGGLELYDKERFKSYNIELEFQKSKEIIYKQFNNEFIPWLSIIDVMMFNSLGEINHTINKNYTLI
jgi:hypothetical protein